MTWEAEAVTYKHDAMGFLQDAQRELTHDCDRIDFGKVRLSLQAAQVSIARAEMAYEMMRKGKP